MSIETGVIINATGPVHWHLPTGRSAGLLPDSRDLWQVFWEHRADEGLGFAHSHPGSGMRAAMPSLTDVTTFDAVERALGRRLRWWITSADCLIEYYRDDSGYGMTGLYSPVFSIDRYSLSDEGAPVTPPDWLATLRKLSS